MRPDPIPKFQNSIILE